MTTIASTSSGIPHSRRAPEPAQPLTESALRGAGRLYGIEALGSVAGSLMSVGIFFYTANQFNWGPARNFSLAAGQGAVYVVGALLAGKLTAKVGHLRVLMVLYTLLAVVAAIGAPAAAHPAAIVAVVLTYTFVISMTWPTLESAVAVGVDAHAMARRLAVYNVVWPATGSAAFAAAGSVIKNFPAGMFFIPAMCHAASALLALREAGAGRQADPADCGTAAPGCDAATATAGGGCATRVPDPAGHAAAEPELLRVRTLALWISRLALPATYAVVYGLMPLMPSLPAMRRLDVRTQTIVGSTWMMARFATFILLALSAWWHTRPRAMLVAAVAMFLAFLGITVPPSQLWPAAATPAMDLAAILLWQVLLGMALGLIYSGSLYFGMVLSEGSTEHGGYHEALIGLGWVLGPAAGTAAQWARPGEVTWGVVAVGCVIALSVSAVAAASILVGRRAAAEA